MNDPLALLASDRAITVTKLPLPVKAAFAKRDGVCATREGPVRYHAGDAILTGVEGEQWPVARALFLESYRPAPGTHAGQDGAYIKRPLPVRAVQLPAAIEVAVGEMGSILRGAPGDWLLRYADGSHGVVAANIFAATYRREP